MGKAPTVVRVTERVNNPFAGVRVDRDAGVIRNVLICGSESKNGRDYLPGSFGQGKQYEGRSVYLNHSDKARQAQDKIGWFSNITFRENGLPQGDFNLFKSHPLAATIFEAAERNPSAFGMSHVAMCKSKRVNGREQIEQVQTVESVDLVAEPATTQGFYESQNKETKMKINELIVWLAPKVKFESLAKVKILSEMDGMSELDMPAPADDSNPDDAVKGAFVSAMHSLVDMYASGQLDGAALLGKMKELDKAHSKMGDKKEPEPETKDEPKEEPEPEEKPESKIPTTDEIKALIAESVAAEVVKLKPILEAEKPKSGGRNVTPVKEQTATEAPPTDGKKFAEYLSK